MFGGERKEVYNLLKIVSKDHGYSEDKFPINMGGKGVFCEVDGMFIIIGRQKCGVGRWYIKKHVHVVPELNVKVSS